MDVSRPFTRADAAAAGIDPRILRTSKFRRLFRGVFVEVGHDDRNLRIRGALALHRPERAFASHHSAARIFGLPVPTDPNEHVTVLNAAHRRPHVGVTCHVVTHDPEPLVTTCDDIAVSHPYAMFIELAGRLDLVNLVVLGDAMVRVLGIAPDELRGACRDSRRYHARKARHAAEFVRAGVDSPMETRLRMLIVLAGLPEPEVGHVIFDDHGQVLWRLDLSYPGLRLAIEYDGRQHAESDAQWSHDVQRREWLDRAGWRLVIVRAADLYRRPSQTVLRIATHLTDRGAAKADTRVRATWRRYFLNI